MISTIWIIVLVIGIVLYASGELTKKVTQDVREQALSGIEYTKTLVASIDALCAQRAPSFAIETAAYFARRSSDPYLAPDLANHLIERAAERIVEIDTYLRVSGDGITDALYKCIRSALSISLINQRISDENIFGAIKNQSVITLEIEIHPEFVYIERQPPIAFCALAASLAEYEYQDSFTLDDHEIRRIRPTSNSGFAREGYPLSAGYREFDAS